MNFVSKIAVLIVAGFFFLINISGYSLPHSPGCTTGKQYNIITHKASAIAGRASAVSYRSIVLLQVSATRNSADNVSRHTLLWIFIVAFICGLLAVFTPYVYAILPITLSYITIISKTKSKGLRNSLYYALSLIIIFTGIGVLISVLVNTTGIYKLTKHWLFNIFFCRIFLLLGLSFLGAFEINLPVKWARKIDTMSGVDSFKSIFYMALSLPVVTISSTGPIVGLVLVFAGNGGMYGPIAGMLGFSIGFGMPFIVPKIINLVSNSITWLNHVKVILGFFSLLIGVKFLSNADVALGWNIIDDTIFIILLILLSGMMGIYMLGFLKLSNDYLHKQNIYNQEFVSISRLFLAIAFFSFAIYLLPGLWGAPLQRIGWFLPHVS